MTLESLLPFGAQIQGGSLREIQEIPGQLLSSLVRAHKLVLLRGFRSLERDEFLRYCKSLPGKEILEWNFGPVMEMRESPDPKNYLFSREEVPFHWDGAFHKVPDYLVFSCVEAPFEGAGGETLFANTELILKDAQKENRLSWSRVHLRYETLKLAHYGGSVSGPLLQKHPQTGEAILRYAEPVRTQLNPVQLEITGTSEPKGLIEDLRARIYDSRYCYRHQWRRGDLLIADNHSLIHGRTAFLKDCPRHLRRIQLTERPVLNGSLLN